LNLPAIRHTSLSVSLFRLVPYLYSEIFVNHHHQDHAAVSFRLMFSHILSPRRQHAVTIRVLTFDCHTIQLSFRDFHIYIFVCSSAAVHLATNGINDSCNAAIPATWAWRQMSQENCTPYVYVVTPSGPIKSGFILALLPFQPFGPLRTVFLLRASQPLCNQCTHCITLAASAARR
jgi:hypothetical protein